MVIAYILIWIRPLERKKLIEVYSKRAEVKEVCEVYGICDVIMKVEVEDLDRLRVFVDELREFEGVLRTRTMIAS